jgi:predicted acyl esterase
MDVYLPRGESAPVPAIVRQTRYLRRLEARTGRAALARAFDLYERTRRVFLTAGYAWVDVDVRGTGASGGRWLCPWSPDEVRDGAEIVDWIIRQPFSNGGDPLAHSFEMTGHPTARLFASFDHDDGRLFAYIEDLAPDGRVAYVSEAMVRVMHRELEPSKVGRWPVRSYRREDARPLPAGEIAEIALEFQPISWLFAQRHRIRLAVCGSDADHFEPSPPGRLRLHRGGSHRSYLELPLRR